MKVLHVLNTGKYSGAENVVITLIHSLDGEVECAYTSPNGPIKEILEKERIAYYPMNTSKVSVQELNKVIQIFEPDIIHTHDFNAGVMASVSGTGIPIINHLHNNVPWLQTICPRSLVYLITCTKYKKILTVSEAVMDEFVFGNHIKNKTYVVGNPIDLQGILIKASQEDVISEASDIMFLGRLSSAKNPLYFLDIINEMVRDNPELKVAMVGSGELNEDVKNKISENKLESNVKIYGFQRNPYALLNKTRVMCMPSKWEGFGLAAVEALALGKPVVCSGVGGLNNIIDNSCGKICNSTKEYVEEIERLLCDDSYYESKSHGAIKRANSYDNLHEYSSVIINVYNEVFLG